MYRRNLRRTNLFLLRVWTENSGNEDGVGESKAEWHGRVQRVVDGESYRFEDLQGLADVLRALLSGITPDTSPTVPESDDLHPT